MSNLRCERLLRSGWFSSDYGAAGDAIRALGIRKQWDHRRGGGWLIPIQSVPDVLAELERSGWDVEVVDATQPTPAVIDGDPLW